MLRWNAGAVLLLSSVMLAALTARGIVIKSPDGNVIVEAGVRDLDGAQGCIVYSVSYRGKVVIAPSRLGLDVNGTILGDRMELTGTLRALQDETWRPVYGERSVIRDRYGQAVLILREADRNQRRLLLTVRAYDQGAAFCYTVPKQPDMESIRITRELTEFRFAADHPAWAVYSAQGRYAAVTLSQIKKGCERPLPIRLADDVFAAIGEARLVDYARMKLDPLAGTGNALVSGLAGPVKGTLPLVTPWRVIMLASSEGKLLEGNDLILNLNDPCAITDTSWIKPGKVIREVSLTTSGGKACVDFANRHGLQYVEFDAGWYGPEESDQSDARAVNLDPRRSRGPLDLHEVIRYGKDHGIGIILYVNRRALERQIDEILPLYRSWGVKGVKYGFVNVGSQHWTTWLHEAVRKAAANQLMVDIHDEYRPTGYSRTYPNLMTQEGIAGDETTPAADQTLTLMFSRFLAGPADNTICYFDSRVPKMGGHGLQLAKAINLYSPWQFLYWYDRPDKAGNEPELEFLDRVPATWDETRVIDGKIGQHAVIARRSGNDWYIGCMNADAARTLEVPLTFLTKGQGYVATIYRDDAGTRTSTQVKLERRTVDSTTTLRAEFSGTGGQAIRIVRQPGL